MQAETISHLSLRDAQRLPNFDDGIHDNGYMRIRIHRSSDVCAQGLENLRSAGYAGRMAQTLSDRIKQIRMLRGLDQTQFGEAVGAGQSTVARWEKGSKPKPEALRAIAEFADITLDNLLGVVPAPIEVAGHECRWVPLIGLAPASSWRDAVTMPMGEVPIRASKAGKRAFGVEIKGDSMDKLLAEGGWAVIDPDQTDLYDGKVYLVANAEHEVTLKRFNSNPARLEPMSHNPTHETLMIAPNQINVIGRVVAYGNDEGL